jgi:hypothetical protein
MSEQKKKLRKRLNRWMKHLKPETRGNNIQKFNSNLTENTLCLHYKDKLINVVYGNNLFLF